MNTVDMHVELDEDQTGVVFSFSPGLWQDCGWYERDLYSHEGLEFFTCLLDRAARELLTILTGFPRILRAELNSSFGDEEFSSTLTVTPDYEAPLRSVSTKVKMAVASAYKKQVDGYNVTFSEGYFIAMERSLQNHAQPELAVHSPVTAGRGRVPEPSIWSSRPMATLR